VSSSPVMTDEGSSHFFELVYDSRNDLFIMVWTPEWYGERRFETWTYDLTSNAWKDRSPSVHPSWRDYYAFVFDESSGVAVLHGGHYEYPGQNLTWIYECQNNTWRNADTKDAPLYFGCQFTFDTKRGRTVLFDGELVWTFGLADQSWEPTSQCPCGRSGLASAFDLWGGTPLMYGGNTGGAGSSDLWRYDSVRDRWTAIEVSKAPPFRCGHAVTYDEANNGILMYGGWAGTNGAAPEEYNDTWVYDPRDNKWTEMNPAVNPGRRRNFGMVYDEKRENHLLFGGIYYIPHSENESVWSYNISANNWTGIESDHNPGARMGSPMGYDPQNDRVVLFGGQDVDNDFAYGDTWIYDIANNTWTNVTPAYGPSSRVFSGFAYYPPAGSFRLFGGAESMYYSGLLDDLWEYNLTTNTWTNITLAAGPSPRAGMAMVYDPLRDEIVLAGGAIGTDDPYYGSNPSETWVLGKNYYRPPGEFTSRPFDTGGMAFFGDLRWNASVPFGTALKFQLRTANTNESLSTASFNGPDGTADTFYTASNQTIASIQDGDRWLQYRAYFDTSDLNFTPVLDRVTITYNLRQSIEILSPAEGNVWSGIQNITWSASDPDNDSLSISIYLENATSSVLLASNLPNGTSTWSWNTSAVPNGTYRIRLSADDKNPTIPLTVNATCGNFTIFHPPPPPPPNRPPAVALFSPLNGSVVNSTSVRLGWNATDPEGDALTFTVRCSSHPLELGMVNETKTTAAYLDLTNLSDNTTYFWTVDAADGTNNHTDIPAGIWSFKVILPPVTPPVNHPPKITSIPPTTVKAGETYAYNVTAIDEDFTVLSFSLVRGPDNMSIDNLTGKVLWTPTTYDIGNHFVTVRVSDTAGASDNQTFLITVLEVPVPPPERPQCAITTPANNSKVFGRIQIVGTALNGSLPLTIIQVRIDGRAWQTAVGRENWSFQLNTGKLAEGRHTVEARAFDGSLYSDTTSVQVTFQRPDSNVTTAPFPFYIFVIIVIIVLGPGVYLLYRKKS